MMTRDKSHNVATLPFLFPHRCVTLTLIIKRKQHTVILGYNYHHLDPKFVTVLFTVTVNLWSLFSGSFMP